MKKTKMRILLLCSIAVMSIEVNGQEPVRESAFQLTEIFSNGLSAIGRKLPPAGTVGSYYANEEWLQLDKLKLKSNDKVFNNLQGRLNTYHKELEVKTGTKVLRIPAREIEELVLGYATYVIPEETLNDFTTEGFYQQVATNNGVSLYKRLWCIKKDPTYVEGVGTGNRDYQLIQKESYHVSDGDSIFKLTNSNKKNRKLLESLGVSVASTSEKLDSPEKVKSALVSL